MYVITGTTRYNSSILRDLRNFNECHVQEYNESSQTSAAGAAAYQSSLSIRTRDIEKRNVCVL